MTKPKRQKREPKRWLLWCTISDTPFEGEEYLARFSSWCSHWPVEVSALAREEKKLKKSPLRGRRP